MRPYLPTAFLSEAGVWSSVYSGMQPSLGEADVLSLGVATDNLGLFCNAGHLITLRKGRPMDGINTALAAQLALLSDNPSGQNAKKSNLPYDQSATIGGENSNTRSQNAGGESCNRSTRNVAKDQIQITQETDRIEISQQARELTQAAALPEAKETATATPESTPAQVTTTNAAISGSISITTSSVTTSTINSTAETTDRTSSQDADRVLLQQGIDLYLSYLKGEISSRNTAMQEPTTPANAAETFLNSLSNAVASGARFISPVQNTHNVIAQTGSLPSLSSLLQSNSSASLDSLPPEQYKVAILVGMMFSTPEERERMLENLSKTVSTGQSIAAGANAPATAATTSSAGVQASLSVSINIDYAALGERISSGSTANFNSLMIDLAVSLTAGNQCDPLVLDLAGNGINLSAAREGVSFDITGDGQAEQTGFIRGDDAFLYLDSNGNGVVDNGKELFGDQEGDANGFAKLSRYDENGDGLIDQGDRIYNELRLWQDLNVDGICQTEETSTLSELGVSSISLNYQTVSEDDGKGNTLAQSGSFTRSDGSQGLAADALLGYL